MTIVQYSNNKPQIKRAAAFCELHKELHTVNSTYKTLLQDFDKKILDAHPNVSRGALNNCHGDWYEWLLAKQAWNLCVNEKLPCIALLLPNISQFDVAELYSDTFRKHILDLRAKVEDATGVSFISSNPDFVIINLSALRTSDRDFIRRINEFTEPSLTTLNTAYENLIGQCDFKDIEGFLSVKSSFRPDRRLQIAHEGSLMKALYIHLQTREWILSPKGLRYYAAAAEVGDADERALRTVATHSITTVQSLPQAAVDQVFTINSDQQANQAFRDILG